MRNHALNYLQGLVDCYCWLADRVTFALPDLLPHLDVYKRPLQSECYSEVRSALRVHYGISRPLPSKTWYPSGEHIHSVDLMDLRKLSCDAILYVASMRIENYPVATLRDT